MGELAHGYRIRTDGHPLVYDEYAVHSPADDTYERVATPEQGFHVIRYNYRDDPGARVVAMHWTCEVTEVPQESSE